MLQVEVAYARPEAQTLLTVSLPPGSCVADAVLRSGLLEQHAEIDWPRAAVGIFGRKVARDTRLRDGDRVEVYRPLQRDPRDRRRSRAAQTR